MTNNIEQQIDLRIDGMSCGHCVSAVREALASVPGVEVKEVGVGFASVIVPSAADDSASPSPSIESRLTDAVDDAGYSAQVITREKNGQ